MPAAGDKVLDCIDRTARWRARLDFQSRFGRVAELIAEKGGDAVDLTNLSWQRLKFSPLPKMSIA